MKGKLARGAMWVAAARAIVNLVGLASTLVLARLLLPADFGLVAIAMTIVAIIASVSELSLSLALVQHQSPSDAHFDTAFTLNAARTLGLCALIAGLAWPMAWLYGDPRVGPVLLAIAGATVCNALASPRMALLTRDLQFRQDFVLTVSAKLLGFAVAVAAAYFYRSYWALVVSLAATQVQGVILSHVFAPYRPRLSLAAWRDLLSFSVWLSLSQTVNTLNWRSDSLLIGYVLGNQPLGYYSFGDNLASMPTREATAPIAQTLFPAFARLAAEPERLRSAYQRSQALLCAAALPIAFGFAMLAKPMIMATVGHKWVPAVIVIQVLSGVFAIQTLASSVQPLALALGETRLLFKRDVANLLIRLPIILVGLAMGGLVGVIWARLCSGTISTVINMGLARKLLALPLRQQVSANLRALLATAAMCAALALGLPLLPTEQSSGPSQLVALAILAVSGGVVYVVASLGLWFACRCPQGPESEIAELARRFLGLRR